MISGQDPTLKSKFDNMNNKAKFYFSRERYVEAIIYLLLAIELDPSSLTTHINLASAYFILSMDDQFKSISEKIKILDAKYVIHLPTQEAILNKAVRYKFFTDNSRLITIVNFIRNNYSFFLAPFINNNAFQQWALD